MEDSDPHELREQDILELGIDVTSKDPETEGKLFPKVAARVERVGQMHI
jgi:hypothetical protein